MIFRLLLLVALLVPLTLTLSRLFILWRTHSQLYTQAQVPPARVAIVFGAGLWRDGSPTPVLRDRVETAADLYLSGKVEKLLMSGDNRFVNYNEPAAMRAYALQLGIPDDAIVLDYAGRRTYDTCYRALHIFGVEQAILVTQGFHLPRALYLCNQLGLPASGVPATRRVYRKASLLYWNLREVPATLVALWEVHITRPLPVMGKPEPIFPLEAQ
ncbi:MAG: ElyC/SanA/YdcF family protein [Chloroflexota bacterium]